MYEITCRQYSEAVPQPAVEWSGEKWCLQKIKWHWLFFLAVTWFRWEYWKAWNFENGHLVDKLFAKLGDPLKPWSSEEGLPHLQELLPDQRLDLLCNAVVLPSESESKSENDGRKKNSF